MLYIASNQTFNSSTLECLTAIASVTGKAHIKKKETKAGYNKEIYIKKSKHLSLDSIDKLYTAANYTPII